MRKNPPGEITSLLSLQNFLRNRTAGPARIKKHSPRLSLQYSEYNLKDIASVGSQPTNAQMLEMALTFETNQDMRFKSAIRLQSSDMKMNFVQDDDTQTPQKMQVFDWFFMGFSIFWNNDAHRIDARLRYCVRDSVLKF